MKHLMFILCLFMHAIVYSQNIKGRIEENGQPLSLVNILLLVEKDSSLVTAAITNDAGNFVFENIKQGDYLLKISRVGYNELYTPLFNLTRNLDLPPIELTRNNNQLDQVRQ